MSTRAALALGLMWGFSLGMAVSGYLAYLEAVNQNRKAHPQVRVVGRDPGAAAALARINRRKQA